MSTQSLRQELQSTLVEIDRQIRIFEEIAAKQRVSRAMLQYADGTYMMPPILLAKSVALAALAQLEK